MTFSSLGLFNAVGHFMMGCVECGTFSAMGNIASLGLFVMEHFVLGRFMMGHLYVNRVKLW